MGSTPTLSVKTSGSTKYQKEPKTIKNNQNFTENKNKVVFSSFGGCPPILQSQRHVVRIRVSVMVRVRFMVRVRD